MRFIFIILIAFVISSTLSKHHLRRRLQGSGPKTKDEAKKILGDIAEKVKLEYSLDVNQIFSDIVALFQGAPHEKYAVLINASAHTKNFLGCPSSGIGNVMGCNPHTTQPGKPNFITKKHGPITNGTIMVKIGETEIGTVMEGYVYSFEKGAFEARGDVQDWRNSCKL